MSWSFLMVLLPTLCYAASAVLEAFYGIGPMAIVFFGYSFANVGFLWMLLK